MTRPARPLPTPDGGFTIVESLIALTLVFAVVLGLLSALGTGVKGMVTGRQRNVAVAIANEIIESARARPYNAVGHDLDSDPTLAGDVDLAGTAPAYVYTDLGGAPNERLAASVVDAGVNAGSMSNPLFPFSPHRWQRVSEGTTFTASVYVSDVTPAAGDPYKRVTVAVSWDRAQTSAAIPARVLLSSFLFDAVQPPDPLLAGLAEADGGTLTVTGILSGMDLDVARLNLPYAQGEIDSRFVRRTTGFAVTAGSLLSVISGTVPGCTVAAGGRSAECPGTKAETSSDNDSGTAPPDRDASGPVSAPGGSVSAGPLAITAGGGNVSALGTARSCWACYGAGVDDDDRLPFQWATAAGPASVTVPFSVSSITGSLLTVAAGCTSDCARATLDRDDVAGSTRLLTSAAVAHPALDLVTVSGSPAMVKVATNTVSAAAVSGPGAPAPTTTGSPFVVQLYSTALPAGYRNVTVTPGTPSETTSSASFTRGLTTRIDMDATVRSGPSATSATSAGGAVTTAEAALTHWLTITVRLKITNLLATLADLVVELDFGRVATRAVYEPS